jgi:hypothetical protein
MDLVSDAECWLQGPHRRVLTIRLPASRRTNSANSTSPTRAMLDTRVAIGSECTLLIGFEKMVDIPGEVLFASLFAVRTSFPQWDLTAENVARRPSKTQSFFRSHERFASCQLATLGCISDFGRRRLIELDLRQARWSRSDAVAPMDLTPNPYISVAQDSGPRPLVGEVSWFGASAIRHRPCAAPLRLE